MIQLVRPLIVASLLALASSQEVDEQRGAPGAPRWTELDERAVETRPIVLEGRVLLPGGAPAAGAVVVTSAGGEALTDGAGDFHLAVELVRDARALHVTAAHAHGGSSLSANARVPVDSAGGSFRTGPLELGAGGSCEPGWLPTFGGHPGTDDLVWALTVYDDGAGPALYVGGRFTMAGGLVAARVARWDGTSWSPLGDGIGPLGSGSQATVHALAVYDDGGGPALYAGGSFTSGGGGGPDWIARWDGTSWSALPASPNNSVFALAVYDDGGGAGPALYAAGSFTSAGGVSAERIARWDGASWSPLGGGLSHWVWALAVHDDGGGPALYAGGEFTSAGGASANHVARWDGASWAPLGAGVDERVFDLAVYDDGAGGGPALYVGGEFTHAGGVSANHVARWDGASWAALGSGIGGGSQTWVDALTVHDDGSGGGPALYAGGRFTSAGGMGASGVARWDGASWSALGGGVNEVFALAGYGSELYAGGFFTSAGGAYATGIASWDGASWSPLGSGLNSSVYALAAHDDGTGGGPALYAGGYFTSANGVDLDRIARWDGASWSPLGSGVNGTVRALATYDDGAGGGPALYAGGSFGSAGGVGASRIARWDGAAWSPLGSGLDADAYALIVHDDGAGGGPALFAAGWFTTAGGASANRIAKWDGASWSALGLGLNATAHALAVHDDGSGSGPALYVAGNFWMAGGMSAPGVARWDGTSWSAVGTGMNDAVLALAVYDDGAGGGPALYVGGHFTMAEGTTANHVARWDGASWSPVGPGTSHSVFALTTHDDGTGSTPGGSSRAPAECPRAASRGGTARPGRRSAASWGAASAR